MPRGRRPACGTQSPHIRRGLSRTGRSRRCCVSKEKPRKPDRKRTAPRGSMVESIRKWHELKRSFTGKLSFPARAHAAMVLYNRDMRHASVIRYAILLFAGVAAAFAQPKIAHGVGLNGA